MKNWTQFNSATLKANQKRLREYVKILKDSDVSDIYTNYFIIIHNFLLLEDRFSDLVKASNKELNKNLNLPKLSTKDDVIAKFHELYNTHNLVRFSVETLDSIEEVRVFLKELPSNFYNKIYFRL